MADRYLRQLRRLMPVVSGMRRAGSAALDLCDVARGRFDAFWELYLNPWDLAAGCCWSVKPVVASPISRADARLVGGPIVASNGHCTTGCWRSCGTREQQPGLWDGDEESGPTNGRGGWGEF